MDRPIIPEQTALWMSSSKGRHILISEMNDRHLLGAIKNVQTYAKWQWEDDENRDPQGNWHDRLPMNTYIPLVQECMRRFLDVPNEDDELFLLELSAKPRVEPSPCCCICKYWNTSICLCRNEGSPKFGKEVICPEKCEKWEKI
jgi:hypothetical protein